MFTLIVICVPLQQSYAQTSPCPANNDIAEQKLKKYLSKEKRIKSLRDQYDMTISDSTKDNIKSLSGEQNKEECQQIKSNLDWLEDQEHYSIYKIADHYFIVLYSSSKEGEFQIEEIPIVNNKFKAVGSIIFPSTSY